MHTSIYCVRQHCWHWLRTVRIVAEDGLLEMQLLTLLLGARTSRISLSSPELADPDGVPSPSPEHLSHHSHVTVIHIAFHEDCSGSAINRWAELL
jgi:hypothetical protein